MQRGRGRGGRGRGQPRGGDVSGETQGTPVSCAQDGPITALFRSYATSLDTQHDRFERLVKASRDVTIGSKRFIFQLHRSDIDTPQAMDAAISSLASLHALFEPILLEVNQPNVPYLLYSRAFSPGVQEFIEAVSFFEFLKTGKLITLNKIITDLQKSLNKDLGRFCITVSDYLLGIADLTGELMRYSVALATRGKLTECEKVCHFLRDIYHEFLGLPHDLGIRDLPSKMSVMQTSIKKVEYTWFSMLVRGSERGIDFSDEGPEVDAF
ncbi:translin-associated protein X [Pelomyxa schiedti]|nr:translin-associated protein X [Pelomyxa schiedti]